jgi:hypothetical protein
MKEESVLSAIKRLLEDEGKKNCFRKSITKTRNLLAQSALTASLHLAALMRIRFLVNRTSALHRQHSGEMGQKDSKESKKQKQNGVAVVFDDLPTAEQDNVCVLPPSPLVNDGDWLDSIPDEEAWLAYKHEPTDRSFSHVSVVTVVLPVSARVKTEADAFFIQSDKWVFHWHFTRDILRDPGSQDLRTFNDLNYQSEERDFVCLTVTKYHDQGMYSFELAARDNYSKEKITMIYELLKRKCFFGDKLFYRPLSKLHGSIVKGTPAEQLPIVESDKLFGGIKYQPLTIGVTYGYLRLVRAEHEHEDVCKARWNDILLCEGIPSDLFVISGLITSVLQTPLCYVALLCGNRGTPNIAAVGSFEDEKLRGLVGKPVKYHVRMSDYIIEPSTSQVVDAWQQKNFPKLRKGTYLSMPENGDLGQDERARFRPCGLPPHLTPCRWRCRDCEASIRIE